MNLSVLIPVYNQDVTGLVTSLKEQLLRSNLKSEIILLDDASFEAFHLVNQNLADNALIFYSSNIHNLGRVQTRKLLAEKANSEYLLFLDCDVKIPDNNFISKYVNAMEAGVDVCTGGLLYGSEPADCNYKLHWKYGTERECGKNKSDGFFLASNFLINKNLFLSLDFDIPFSTYGHEDTAWNIQLKEKRAVMKSIRNPVIHEGLTETAIYIERSLQAVGNILVLENYYGKEKITAHIKLYNRFIFLRKFFLTGIIDFAERFLHKRILTSLSSCHPSLFYFDLLRLAHLIRKKKQN